MQELSVEIAGDIKEFHGQGRYALAIAQGKVKVSGKMKGAIMDALSLNTLFFGTGTTSGTMKAIYADTTGTTIAATVTPVVPNGGTVDSDDGVMIGGVAFQRVASAPATGQYAYNEGVYTFATADVGKLAYISFTYIYPLAAAKKFSLNNLPMGSCPRFRLEYMTEYQGKKVCLILYAVVAPKLRLLGGKNDDFSVPDIDFQAACDDSGFALGELVVCE